MTPVAGSENPTTKALLASVIAAVVVHVLQEHFLYLWPCLATRERKKHIKKNHMNRISEGVREGVREGFFMLVSFFAAKSST